MKIRLYRKEKKRDERLDNFPGKKKLKKGKNTHTDMAYDATYEHILVGVAGAGTAE